MICRPDNEFKCVELCVKVYIVTLQARTAVNSGDAGFVWRRQQGGEEAEGVGEGGGVQGAGAGPSQTACSLAPLLFSSQCICGCLLAAS